MQYTLCNQHRLSVRNSGRVIVAPNHLFSGKRSVDSGHSGQIVKLGMHKGKNPSKRGPLSRALCIPRQRAVPDRLSYSGETTVSQTPSLLYGRQAYSTDRSHRFAVSEISDIMSSLVVLWQRSRFNHGSRAFSTWRLGRVMNEDTQGLL
jgi:hypothetical protein